MANKPKQMVYDSVTEPLAIVKGFEREEDQAVATLLYGIPAEGGSASKEVFERLVRMAFQGGLVAATKSRN